MGIFQIEISEKFSIGPGQLFTQRNPPEMVPISLKIEKIDDFQKILENPEKYPEEFLNESLIKI